ncbi:hypothetical protein WJX75_004541 [Coccomyxa subellipsoidea]|uniref:TPX2 C-terminal domain-containing protein n=1 Tax=Coccomyxa subellipsoidea TaxID=248742 RepID=A0ABR2YWU6_9CHLO
MAERRTTDVLAQLLASKELSAHIGANSTEPTAAPEVQGSGSEFGSAAGLLDTAAHQHFINGQANKASSGHAFYNGRGSAVPAAAPTPVTGQSAARQGRASGAPGGGPYEYTVATTSTQRLWFRGGPTAEDAGRAMYARAMAARERAERRHETVRAQRQAAEEAACSFSPRTNRARNDALLRGHASWPPADTAPEPGTSQGKSRPPRTPRLAGQAAGSSLQLSGNPFRSPSAHAGERMYAEALRSLERQRTATQLTIQEELEQMRAAAPQARSLPPSIYGAGAMARVRLIRTRSISPRRRNPAYQDLMKECTFKPKTLWRSRSAAQTPRSHSLNRQQDPPARSGAPARRRPQRASISADEALDRFLRRASLTANQVPKLLHITEPDQERQPGNESADTPDHAIADGLEQLALGGDASTDSTDAAVKSGKESTQQLPRQQEGAFQGLAPDLDFDEFLQRQKTFVEERSRKVELTRTQTAKRLGKTIGISPGSESLLRQWKTVKVERKGSFHKAGKENGGRGRPLAHAWSLDNSFRPKITRRAQLKKARSVEELHEGGRLQRERTLEQLRLERTAAEEAQMTFAPSINPCYSVSSRPLLDLADPDPYLAHAESQRRRLEASRQQAAEERKEKELADCTFSPRTIPLPAFMQRLSGAHGSMSHSKSDLESYAQQLKWL